MPKTFAVVSHSTHLEGRDHDPKTHTIPDIGVVGDERIAR